MDLATALTEEQVNPGKLLDVLASINGTIGGNIDISTENIPTAEDTLQPLQDSLKGIEGELANFLNTFPSTAKPLIKDKKIKRFYPRTIKNKFKLFVEKFRLPY